MRRLIIAIALLLLASAGTATLSMAALPGAGAVKLTLQNTSDACVWVTTHDGSRELGTHVLQPGNTWIIESWTNGGTVKVRAQMWAPKNGCHGSFIEDRYDFIHGKTAMTILRVGNSYIMRR